MMVYQDAKLTLFQSALYQTNTLVFDGGSFLLVVDPNWLPQEVQTIRDYVTAHSKGKSIYLLFTHSDYDHIIAYGLFPEAKVIASERFQHSIHKAKNIQEIHDFDQQHYLQRSYPIVYPEVDIVIAEDGQQVVLDDQVLTFYLAPGHTDDGIFTIIETEGIFIAGDYLSDLEFPFIYFDSDAYRATLSKVNRILQSHVIHFLVPGHGRFLKDQNAALLQRKDRDVAYLKALRACVVENIEFPLEEWLARFPFPNGLREAHEKNWRLEMKNKK